MLYFNFLILGLFIHVIFLLSVFDVYFTSPIVPNITPVKNSFKSLAKRIVLISVDGLPVDALFEVDTTVGDYAAPYIHKVMKEKGSWGVSQSHIPTESRPGHVAMLAGFYEDPSAVTKGWKQNPVDFDSIFNQSHCSFAWGSPDIIDIFYKDLKHDCAFSETYKNEQNFAGDTRKLDDWVFDKVKSTFEASSNKFIHNVSAFFFLHLLGQDTSGHTDKPHTEKYFRNLRNVDRIVQETEALFIEFYKDNQTTFIVTSDHGMTDWGSHGAGDASETDTPFIAWGAGITSGKKGLNISQADITPLLAILLGVSIPVNSVGFLPVFYLSTSQRHIAEAMSLNARQMTSQFSRKLEVIQDQSLPWLYSPFPKLSIEEIKLTVQGLSDLIAQTRYDESVHISEALIQLSLEGLDYYHNYYQRSLFLFITLSYLAWIMYLILEVLADEENSGVSTAPLRVFFGTVIMITMALIAVQRLPLLFYCYYLLPEVLIYHLAKRQTRLRSMFSRIRRKHLTSLLCILGGVELLVAAFFTRCVLSITMLGILFWSIRSISWQRSNKIISGSWLISGMMLSVFPLLPVVGNRPAIAFIATSGVALTSLSASSFFCSEYKDRVLVAITRTATVAIAALNSAVVHMQFEAHGDVPLLNHCVSWALCLTSCVLLLAGSSSLHQRLTHTFMCLSVPFLLLTVSHEGIFLVSFFVHLSCWVHIESLAHKNGTSNVPLSKRNSVSDSDFRTSYFFLTYISVAFFGIGNIASLNSFDPAWVRCFVTVFSPFLMSSLILFKTIIPFLAVTCTLRVLAVSLDIKLKRMFMIVLIYSNLMGVNFLYMITNRGSWLEIGTSLSHYVIQQVTVVFLVLLYGIAQFLMALHQPRHSFLDKLQ